MSWNQKDFSGYSFSEYNQPAERKPEEIGYTDPQYYQSRPESAPRSTMVTQQPAQMTEYRSPAGLEHYTHDVGAALREAAKEGSAAPAAERRREGLAALGGLGTIFAVMAKFGLAGVSALISVAVYASIFGWAFGIGLVALLFIHESGHAIVMKLKGIPIGGMVFVPMIGAAVFMSRMPRNAKDEAEVGIAGPVAGALASAVCLFIALATPYVHSVWIYLAYFGFLLNLLNLVPVLPLDGGRVLAAIDRRIWIIGFVGLVVIEIWQWVNGVGSIWDRIGATSSVWLLIFIIMAATQLFARRQNTPEAQAYYAVPLRERFLLGVAYFGLIAVLVLGMSAAHSLMPVP